MKLIRKIDSHCEPPGLERLVLKKLPMYLAGGTAVPLLVTILGRLFPTEGAALEIGKLTRIIDYIAMGAVFTVWTAALTVAIGCLVVMVMKGPTYEADSYYMEDPDHPDRNQREEISSE